MRSFKDTHNRAIEVSKAIEATLKQLSIQANSMNLENRLRELERNNQDWNHQNIKQLKEASKLKLHKQTLDTLCSSLQEQRDLVNLCTNEEDLDMLQETSDELKVLEKQTKEFYLKSMLDEEMDESSCFIELRQGAGGAESCDWVQILTRMYERWGEIQGYQTSVTSFAKGEVAGYKNSTIKIQGSYAFGFAKYESGVHRFVRISPFDSNGKRHTYFSS